MAHLLYSKQNYIKQQYRSLQPRLFLYFLIQILYKLSAHKVQEKTQERMQLFQEYIFN